MADVHDPDGFGARLNRVTARPEKSGEPQPKTLKEITAEITEQAMNAFRHAAVEAEQRKLDKQRSK